MKFATGDDNGLNISLSLLCQIAHYVNPSPKVSLVSIKTRAVRFLTLKCKIWKVKISDSIRPDLLMIL
jgi:hypothetical protein